MPSGLFWSAVWTGQSASTTPMVAAVQKAVDSGAAAADALEALKLGAERGIQAAQGGELSTLLEVLNEYHNHLFQLGKAAGVDIVTEPHRRLSGIAREAGGAYKPSGAGGGDLGVLFAQSEAALAAMKKAAEEDGFSAVDMALEPRAAH